MKVVTVEITVEVDDEDNDWRAMRKAAEAMRFYVNHVPARRPSSHFKVEVIHGTIA